METQSINETVGGKLLAILDGKDDVCNQDLLGVIDEIVELIQTYRTTHKLSKQLKNNCLIDCMFPSWRKISDDRKRTQVVTQCALEFLAWCRSQISEDGFVPREMLRSFYYDTAFLGYLGGAFGIGGRSHTWIPIDSFRQAFGWFVYEQPPQRLVSEFLSIFELRQSMELKFRNILGIVSVDDGIKIKHGTVPNILKQNISAKNFSPQNGIGLTQIMHVYDWTDISIHNMQTDCVWIVWKAMMVVRSFFECTPRFNGMMSIHDSFEFSRPLLDTMRTALVAEIKKLNPKKDFVIEWGVPEAAIVDEKGKWVKIEKYRQEVKAI